MTKKFKIILIATLIGVLPSVIDSSSATAQTERSLQSFSTETISDTEDRRIFQKIISETENKASLGETIQTVATKFLGAKYQAGLLDRFSKEKLVISLQKFDCLLLVENVIAIAKNITLQDNNYDNFTQRVEQHRYNNGLMDGYCSRLHYFSDWIQDNQARGNVENITRELGGVTLNKQLNFMTSHRNSYAQLINSKTNYQCIAAMEANLNEELVLNYIPTNRIRNIYSQLQPGDIIAIATSIPGLDVTHTGLVYRPNNNILGLIHASPVGKVVIASDLQNYVSKVRNAIGIIVVRSKLSNE